MKSSLSRALLALTLASSLVFIPAASAADEKPEVPIISLDETIQKDLLNLDRLLDTNPKLEEELRTNADRLTESVFRAQNPEIDALLKRQPGLVKALKTEKHFFVHRQVARIAQQKVLRKDAVALDNFLTANPEIAKALRKKPSLIVDGSFLVAHPPLAKFFEAHPGLSSVLLKRQENKKEKDAKTAPQKKAE
ncbi:MAG: hypothetical protein V4773_18045 [Verrucomicrobiota bacterium]